MSPSLRTSLTGNVLSIDYEIPKSFADRFTGTPWEATLLVGEPTPRCAVPSASPDTGIRDRDVLRELLDKRGPIEGEACMGVYAEVLEPGVVRVGDELRVL